MLRGPWNVKRQHSLYYVVYGGLEKIIAVVCTSESDARFIARAPERIAELEEELRNTVSLEEHNAVVEDYNDLEKKWRDLTAECIELRKRCNNDDT